MPFDFRFICELLYFFLNFLDIDHLRTKNKNYYFLHSKIIEVIGILVS